MNFQSPQQLEDWLRNNAVDTSQWGSGTTKSTANLWQELNSGDSILEPDPPLRKVRVATLLVIQNHHQLIEGIQTFDDGRQRLRNRPPSEKIMQGETVEAAALRCLHEEVGCTAKNILSAPHLLKTETIHRDSPSYPTLESVFTIHTLEVRVAGLPTGAFTTENQAVDDPIRSIEWHWRDRSYLGEFPHGK